MEMKTVIATVLVATIFSTSATSAESSDGCYTGGHETGVLEFSGAVEGSGFTGSFDVFAVTYCMADAAPADGEIEVSVELATADTDNRDRDQTLKGEEFFAVERYPRATWNSLAIERDGSEYIADGELKLKGIVAAQTIRFTLEPDGEALVARGEFTLQGGAEVNRQRFDVGTGEFADPEFVRNRVDVAFEVLLGADE